MTDDNGSESTARRLTPTTIALIAGAVVVVGVGGFFLWKVMARAKVDSLIHALTSPDVAEQKAAQEELEERSGKSRLVAEVLVENLARVSGDDLSQEQVFKSLLVQIGDENTVAVLSEALVDPETDAPTRRAAVEVLSQIRHPEAAVTLAGLLDHEQDGEAAMEGLSSIGEVALPAVTARIGDGDPEVRRRVVVVLGRIGDPRALSTLDEALDDHEAEVRLAAVQAVSDVGGEEACELLVQALEDGEAEVRERAIDALEKVADESAARAAVGALDDESARVRATAARILGEVHLEEAVAPLLAALDDDRDEVLIEVVEALGSYEDRRAVEPLVDLLDHENPNVRRRAITALGDIGEPSAVEAILAGPDSTTEPAVVAYGELADPRATEKLIDVLVTEVTLKRKALDALAAIDDERTLELAVPVVRESSYTMEVKKDIVETLISTLTGQTIAVEEPLEELLAGEEGEEESG